MNTVTIVTSETEIEIPRGIKDFYILITGDDLRLEQKKGASTSYSLLPKDIGPIKLFEDLHLCETDPQELRKDEIEFLLKSSHEDSAANILKKEKLRSNFIHRFSKNINIGGS